MSDAAFHEALGLTGDERLWCHAINAPEPDDVAETDDGWTLLMLRIMTVLPSHWTVDRVALVASSFQQKLNAWNAMHQGEPT